MAATRILPSLAEASSPSFPVPPPERPAVVAASRLLGRVEAELAAAKETEAAAHRAIAAAAASQAEATLAALEAGEPPPEPDPALQAAVRLAGDRIARAVAARDLAALRHREALDQARADLGAELRERVADLIAEAAADALSACEINDTARSLLNFGAENRAPGIPPAYEGALRLPSVDQLHQQLEAAGRALQPPKPAATPAGKVAIRWLVHVMPYSAGETCGVDSAEAQLQVRAGNAELVDPGQAKALKLDKLVRFDGPVRIRLTKNYSPRVGAMIPEGREEVFDAVTAARIVNLSFGEVA